MALEASTIALIEPSLLHEQAYIDGEWCDADDGATFAVTNPATGEVDDWVETRYLSLGGIG